MAPKTINESRIEWNSTRPASRNAPATAAASLPASESAPCCMRVISVMKAPASSASETAFRSSGASTKVRPDSIAVAPLRPLVDDPVEGLHHLVLDRGVGLAQLLACGLRHGRPPLARPAGSPGSEAEARPEEGYPYSPQPHTSASLIPAWPPRVR